MVGVPSTIDNDLYGNDVSIGCDTAINITLEAIDRLRTTVLEASRPASTLLATTPNIEKALGFADLVEVAPVA